MAFRTRRVRASEADDLAAEGVGFRIVVAELRARQHLADALLAFEVSAQRRQQFARRELPLREDALADGRQPVNEVGEP